MINFLLNRSIDYFNDYNDDWKDILAAHTIPFILNSGVLPICLLFFFGNFQNVLTGTSPLSFCYSFKFKKRISISSLIGLFFFGDIFKLFPFSLTCSCIEWLICLILPKHFKSLHSALFCSVFLLRYHPPLYPFIHLCTFYFLRIFISHCGSPFPEWLS